MEESVNLQEDDLGLVGRMTRVFFAPAETFEAVQLRSGWLDWFVPGLLAAAVATASMSISLPLVMKAQQEAAAKMTQSQNLTEEQRAQQRALIEKTAGITKIITLVSTPVTVFVMVFVFGGVYLLIGRLVLGGAVTYPQTLAVHGYVSLISVVQILVLTPIREARQSMIVALGPGLLLGEEMLSSFAGRMIAAVDIFNLWQIAVAAIGLSVLARASVGKALTALLVIYAVYLVIAAGVGGAFLPGT